MYITHFNPWNPKFGAAMRNYGILRGLSRNHDIHVALASSDHKEIGGFLDAQRRSDPVAESMTIAHPRRKMGGCAPLSSTIQDVDNKSIESLNRYILDVAVGKSSNGQSENHKRLNKLNDRQRFHKPFLELVEKIDPDIIWYFTKYSLRKVGFAPGIPCVLDLDDVPWRKLLLTGKHQQGLNRMVALSKVLPSWLEDYWLALRASVVVITNPEEVSLLSLKRQVIPVLNGFDFPDNIFPFPRQSKTILFFGSLFYYPNLDGIRWFCQKVWPIVKARMPEAELDIVGLYHEGMEHFQDIEGVNLVGFVEDLNSYIDNSAFLVVPLRIGSGTRIKILEAWSKGLPVISTTIGAEGLGAVDGETALVRDYAEDFAQACIQLLNSPKEGIELACNGFAYSKEHFSWESIYPTLENVLRAAST
jgi:glycosyltransferase involved in cell wall biosynthesis